jgi:hypothetical protein
LHVAALEIFAGVEMGVVFPVGPVGAEPHVARMASFPPVLAPIGLDAVGAPVGLDAVGTTAGTEPHDLS